MRILALTRYGRLGPSSRVRFYQYFPYLGDHGVQIEVAPLLSDEYVSRLYAGKRALLSRLMIAYARRVVWLLESRSFDLLWVEKELFPWLPAWWELFLSRSSIPYIVDYDDAAFHRYDLHPNPIIRKVLGRKIDAVMLHASITVVGNEYLAARARNAGAQQVEYLPSVIDGDRYLSSAPNPHLEFRIGWIGSPVTAPYLNLIHRALEQVAQQFHLRLIVVGAHVGTPLPPVPSEILPWSEATEVECIRSFDIGIMPLPDEPFERGKCGYKLIQYMGCGIPVIASPVGANLQIVENGSNGYLASSTEEWVTALMSLANDPQLRTQMGKAGRQKVEQEYSLQVAAPRLLAILQKAISLRKV